MAEKSPSYLKVSPHGSLNGLGSSDFSSVGSGDRDQEPEFRENVDKWRCPLCTRVVRNPVQTPCAHRFCDSFRVDELANVSTKKSKSYFKVTSIPLGSSDVSSVGSGERDKAPEFRENVDKWKCPLCTREIRKPV